MLFKTKLFFPLLLLIISISVSCDKEEDEISGCTDSLSYNYNPNAVSDDGTCEYYYGGREKGQIDVGSIVDLNNEYNIYIDGEYIGRLTHYFPNGLECGNLDAVGRIFDSGSHVIRAEGNGGTEIREGIVVLEPQTCKVVLLETLPIVGGGNTTGDVIFWINEDFGCGNISVTINGIGSTTISGYYASLPECSYTNAGGNINDIAAGTYNYSASCSGYNWNGTVNITANSCLRFQLTR